jgi:large subunit ribosomal protein L21
MIAVVEIGGKQYTVEKDQMIEVDHQDFEVGASFDTPALLISDAEGKSVKIGTPTVEGAKVTFKVIDQFKAEKVRVFKMKAKKRHMRTYGFRAHRTTLQVSAIA